MLTTAQRAMSRALNDVHAVWSAASVFNTIMMRMHGCGGLLQTLIGGLGG